MKIRTKAPSGIAGLELLAKQVEMTLLNRSTESRKGELSHGRGRMRELRGADPASRGRK